MKLIKKSEKLLLQKMKDMEEIEEVSLPDDTIDASESTAPENPVQNLDNYEPDYIPFRNHPVVHSVGNTGWQVSEIWKEIRLDNF